MTAPWPHGDPRAVAERIVADGRYQLAPQNPRDKSWLELLGDALNALWQQLMSPLGHLLGNKTLTSVIGSSSCMPEKS